MDVQHIIAVSVVALPILALLMGGVFIAARSGVEHVSSSRDMLQIAGNFSGILLRVAGYVVVLMLVQHFIGLRPSFGW